MFPSATIRHRLLAPFLFAKSPPFSSISAAAAVVTDFPQNDAVSRIISHFNSSPLRYSNKLLLNFIRDSNWFKNEIPNLESSEIDSIIEKISSHSAIEFFFLLQNEFGVKHSQNSQFIIAHLLAEKKRPRALLCHLQMVIQEQGNPHFIAIIVFYGTVFRRPIDSFVMWPNF